MSSKVKQLKIASKGAVVSRSIPYVRLIVLSVVAGFVLEAGQLFGAPFASVMNLEDWSKKSILIYALLTFIVGWLAFRFDWTSRARKTLAVVRIFFEKYGKKFVICIALGVVLAGIFDLLITVFSGFSEPLPLGLFFFSLFVTGSLAVAFREFIAVKMEWFFLVCILSLGISFIVLSPIQTTYSWDDQIHYGNSVALSYLDNGDKFSESDGVIFEYRHGDSSAEKQYEVSDLLESWEEQQAGVYVPLDSYNNSSLFKNSLSNYSSLGYVPSAIGLYLSRLLHLPHALIFDFGKIGNLLFFSIIVFMGMRKLKSKKTIACAVMLLPTTVFLACNYSYDPWLIGLLFYAIASLVGILQSGKTINRSDVAKILSAFLLGLGPKAIYFPLVFLLLLVPKKQFSGNVSVRTYHIAVLATVLIALASFVLPMVLGGATSDLRGGSDVNATGQIKGILEDPVGYFGLMASFSFSFLNMFNASGYTTLLGYLGIASYLAPLFYVWLPISALLDDGWEENRSFSNVKWFFACLAAIVCVLLGIFSALYITFTPVGAPTIEGVQGRYLTPLLFAFLVFCLNFKLPRIISRQTACLAAFSISAIGLYAVYFILFVSVWVG